MMDYNFAESLKKYTHRDYDDLYGLRCEMFYGYICPMDSPRDFSPSLWHQRTVGAIYYQLRQFLSADTNKQGEAILSPFDVRLFDTYPDVKNDIDERKNNIVQPDLLFVHDKAKVARGVCCDGAPDFVVEVVSGFSKIIDVISKKDIYLKYGVKEYWVVGRDRVLTYLLNEGSYTETGYDLDFNDMREIPVAELPGCFIQLKNTVD